jgi:hypothetical protein
VCIAAKREDAYFKKHGRFRDSRTYFDKLRELQEQHGYSFKTVLLMSDDARLVESIKKDRTSLGLAAGVTIASTDDPYRVSCDIGVGDCVVFLLLNTPDYV